MNSHVELTTKIPTIYQI